MFEIVEEFEFEPGWDCIVWRCKYCGYEVMTEANGEPSCCPFCIAQEAEYDKHCSD